MYATVCLSTTCQLMTKERLDTVPDICIQGGHALVVGSLYCIRLSSALCSFVFMSVTRLLIFTMWVVLIKFFSINVLKIYPPNICSRLKVVMVWGSFNALSFNLDPQDELHWFYDVYINKGSNSIYQHRYLTN